MKRSLLLVDDDEAVRAVTESALQLVGGWSVTSVGSGIDALRVTRITVPDAILLDVMMPGLDGPATLLELRKDPSTASIPVIFFTAMIVDIDHEALLSTGALGVVFKPFDPMNLSIQIAEILGFGPSEP